MTPSEPADDVRAGQPPPNSRWFTVVIPTRDSAGWIAELLAYYRRHGIVPAILLDARTTDDTHAIARRFGCRIVMVHDFSFTEGVVGRTVEFVDTPWVLFMHDDEAPSRRLLEKLREGPPTERAPSVAISRRWAWYSPGEPLAYGRTALWNDRTGQPGLDHSWRLFRPDQVRFIDVVHTEGFLIERWARLPPEFFFVHFEWVLRTFEQRVMKLRRYDRHRYGYGRMFEKIYLPETLDRDAIAFLPFEGEDFDDLARAYHAARRPEIRVTRRTFRDHFVRLRYQLTTLLSPPRLEPRDRIGLTPSLDDEVR